MSKTLEMTAQPAVSSIGETDRLYVESGGSLHPIAFSALAKAVRESIKIGGRNLLLDSGIPHANTYKIANYKLSEPWQPGKTYIMTVWGVELAEGKTNFQAWNKGGVKALIELKLQSDGTYRGTFTPTSALDLTKADEIGIYAFPQSVAGVNSLTRAKFEEGNIPTDWTPAPEDLESAKSGGVICSTLYALTGQEGGQRDEQGAKHLRCTPGFGSYSTQYPVSAIGSLEAAYVGKPADYRYGFKAKEFRRADRDGDLSVQGRSVRDDRRSAGNGVGKMQWGVCNRAEGGHKKLLSVPADQSYHKASLPHEVCERVEIVVRNSIDGGACVVTVKERKEVAYV